MSNQYQQLLDDTAIEIAADVNQNGMYQVEAYYNDDGTAGVRIPEYRLQSLEASTSNQDLNEDVISEVVKLANTENNPPPAPRKFSAGKGIMLNPKQRAKLDASLRKSSTPLADATNQPEKKTVLFVPKEKRSGPRIKSIEILEAPHPATMPHTLNPPPTFFEQSLLNAFQDAAAAPSPLPPPPPPPPTVVQTADPPLTPFEKNLLAAFQDAPRDSEDLQSVTVSDVLQLFDDVSIPSMQINSNVCSNPYMANGVTISTSLLRKLVPGIQTHSKAKFISIIQDLVKIPPPPLQD